MKFPKTHSHQIAIGFWILTINEEECEQTLFVFQLEGKVLQFTPASHREPGGNKSLRDLSALISSTSFSESKARPHDEVQEESENWRCVVCFIRIEAALAVADIPQTAGL